MARFQHVLCPIDFSEPSTRAVSLAKDLSRDWDSRLTVTHVVDTKFTALGALVPVEEMLAASRHRAEREMNELVKSLRLDAAQTEILEGEPHRALLRRIDELQVDLLVMATHGYSGFERLFLGSVTEKVLHQVRIPLLAIRGADRRQKPGASRLFGRIMVGIDFGPDTDAIVAQALSFADHYRAKLLVVHALPLPREVLGGPGGTWLNEAQLRRLQQDMKQGRLRALEELIPARVRKPDTEFVVQEGSPTEVLLRAVENSQVDLLVVGAHGFGGTALGWLGSTCHKLIRAAPCPVLAVRKRG